MFKKLLRGALLAFALLPAAAAAEPVKLKFAYFSSDRTTLYLAGIKPFVDAVNSDGAGLVEIEMNFSGALGRNPAQQLQLVLDGTADMALIIPGYTPERFHDNTVIELPGTYRSMEEATLVYTRLTAANALSGYQDVYVLGAYATEPETIHSRPPVASLNDLRGKRIRVNNPAQGKALTKLGAIPEVLAINMVPASIGNGEIDGATVPPGALIEFGISRMTSSHYLLGIGAAPLAMVINRKKFGSLPKESQDLLRKYGGEWMAWHFIATNKRENNEAITQLKSDPNRKVSVPSASDSKQAQAAFEEVVKDWLAESPQHRELLAKAEAELAKIRSGQ